MITKEELCSWLLDIESFVFIRELKDHELSKYRSIICGYVGEVKIDQHQLQIVIGVDNVFPLSVPKIFLSREKEIILPHIEPDGFVCYLDQEVVVDYSRPKDIIEDALKTALNTIKKSIEGESDLDLINEFEDYWGRNENCVNQLYFSCFEPTESVTKLYTTHLKKGKKKISLFGTNDSLEFLNTNLLGLKKTNATKKPVIYIPITEGKNLLPQTYKSFWSFQELRERIWADLDKTNRNELNKILKGWKTNKTQYILLGIKSPVGLKLVGVECKNINSLRCHPLNSDVNIIKASPFHINRYDENVIKARGETTYKYSKVLIIGCGSLGSRIATEIMQVGIKELHLVDNDTLWLENTYRHQLGKDSVSINKAIAMRNYLKQRFPFEKFVSHNKKIEDLVLINKVDLSKYDVIISATGSPNSSFFLNQFLIDKKIETPIIYTWNDPYSIGGHNLLISNYKKSCYRCLYENDGVTNRASFCEPGQRMLKKIAGCSSGFVPFSNLDCLRTCLDCIDLLQTGLNSNKLKSWKGDGAKFLSEGLNATSRFNLSQTELDSKLEFNKNKNCRICNEVS